MANHTLKIEQTSIFKNLLTSNTIFLAALSGILLFLSFPKYGSGFITWIALIPLFLAIRDVNSLRKGFILGFICGLIFHIGLIYWITYVVVNYGYLPLYLGIIIMLLLACYLSLYTALFAAGIVFLRQKIALFLAAPVLWICLEYCKSYLFTGFPWENLGYSQYLNNSIVQFADISGVFGLSFLIVLANAALFELIVKKSRKEFAVAAGVILIIAGILIYGINRSKDIDEALSKAAGIEVSLIQGNISQSIKWDDGYRKETINNYEQLSLQNIPVKEGLLVWPETAVPFSYQDGDQFQEQVRNISLKTKSWFIFGSTSYENSKNNLDFYNSAYLLSPNGEIKGRYDKVHLVPYGEYVPLRDFFPFISKLTAGIGDFSSGTGYYPLNMGKKKVGVLICYEGILPSAAAAYKKEGAELLVNITNDAWFGPTSAPFQHFSMAVFRAVETRLYLVRAANTGISAIINPTGDIVVQTDIFKKAAIKYNVKYSNIKTIYSKYGDVLVLVCFGLIVFFCFIILFKGREKNAGRKYRRNNK
ncbi:MAG: apolipoprotein N-acyltransferase [Smithella sp.]